MVTVTPRPDRPERVARALAGTVDVADTRTMQQDVDFAIRQLVDVGLRALSPAVNDPNTAVEVVLRIGGLLRLLLRSHLPLPAVEGPGGRVLVRPWELDHEEYLAHGLDQLRQSAGSQTQVLAALLRTVRMLELHVRTTHDGDQDGADRIGAALRRHRELLVDAVRAAGLHPADRDHLLAMDEEATDPADHEPPTVDDGER